MTLTLITIALCFANIFYTTLVANLLWGWYIVPLGMPMLNYAHTAGILVFISIFKGKKNIEIEPEKLQDILCINLLYLSLSLILGIMFKSWI